MKMLARILLGTIIMWVATQLNLVTVENIPVLLVFVVLYAILGKLFSFFLNVILLPFTIITLGIGLVIANGMAFYGVLGLTNMFMGSGSIVLTGGFFSAIIFAIIFSFINSSTS